MTNVTNVLNFIASNWGLIVIGLVLLSFVVYELAVFYKLPNNQKVKRIKECLLALVTVAAKSYDEGDYDLIVATVYNNFCNKFPILKSIIPIDIVKSWIKEAFDNLKSILATQNKTLASLRNNKTV